MAILDISYSAALMCSRERIRGRSEKLRNALLNKHVGMQQFVVFRFGGYFLKINSVATQSYLLQNPATNTKLSYILYT